MKFGRIGNAFGLSRSGLRSAYLAFTLTIAFIGAPQFALAADWIPAYETPSGSILSVDKSSIKPNREERNSFNVWLMIDAREDETVKYTTKKVFATLYCDEYAYAVRDTLTKYDNDVPQSRHYDTVKRPVPPESMWEGIHAAVCEIGNPDEQSDVRSGYHETRL